MQRSFQAMPKPSKAALGTATRRAASLLAALTFVVLVVTGILAFVQPFSLEIIGLHSLMGFVFIAMIFLHLFHNRRPLVSYLQSKTLWSCVALSGTLTALFWWQPAPVKTILGWSGNLGPAMERFDLSDDGMVFSYRPSPQYLMRLDVKTGSAYQKSPPPHVAIWLENQGGYHIKTLLEPATPAETPYWAFKRAGWEKAKREAEDKGEIDAITSPTPNGSFDPADYILPGKSEESMPYSVLLEINQADDQQASLVYEVVIDNANPTTYQLLELRGYPQKDGTTDDGMEKWALYYIDESFTTALDLIDSALLTIERGKGF